MKVVLKIVIITLVIFIVALCAINAPDRELRPGVKEIVALVDKLPPGNGGDGNNAYFAVLGFEAPQDADIVEAGRRVHEQYYSSIQDESQVAIERVETTGSALSFDKSSDIPQCSPDESGCLAFYGQTEEKHAQLFKNNSRILDRYDRLRSFSEYQDYMRLNPWSSLARLSSAIYSAHALYTAEAAHLFNNGRQQKGVDLIVADIRLWRMLFSGSADIDGKTYCLLALIRDYTLLGEMISSFSSGAQQVIVESAVLALLTEKEKSLDLVFDGYLQALYWNLVHHRHPFEQSKMTLHEKYFFKVNATMNNAYEIFDSLKRTSVAVPDQLSHELSLLDEKIQTAKHKRIDMLYNPLGKMFISVSFDSRVATDWNKRVQLLTDKITTLAGKVNEKVPLWAE